MKRSICLIALAALTLPACTLMGGEKTTTYTAEAADTVPMSTAAPVVREVRRGPRLNAQGGEIPSAKPTTDVEDGGLGEVRTGDAGS